MFTRFGDSLTDNQTITMARKPHIKKCPAPLCMSCKKQGWKEDFVWYPGEKICDRKPYTGIQKKQKKINELVKKGDFVHTDRYFTAEMLEDRDKISRLTRGASPSE